MPISQPSIDEFLHSFRSTTNVLHLHALICQSGLEAYPSLGGQLISSFADAQSIGLAQQVFDKLVYQDDLSWSSFITGCVRCRNFPRARMVFQQMQENNLSKPTVHAYVALLKACAMTKDSEWGCKLYTEISQNGLLEKEKVVGSALVNMFAKCGMLERAQTIFDELPFQDVVSWNALMAGYVDQGQGENALECFLQMEQLGVSFNFVTLVCCLMACGSTRNLNKGQELHVEALKKGFEVEPSVGNNLIDMYAKCGQLDTAQVVFDNLSVRNVVSWNVLITGYVEAARFEDALHMLEIIHENAFAPNDVTFLCSLKACSNVGSLEKGLNIHDQVIKLGLEKEPLIANTLVDMYAKCGSLATAEKVMQDLSASDVVLWNALVAAYADSGCVEDAFRCIENMEQKGISPNTITLTCLLKGCSSVEATSKGHKVHAASVMYGVESELFFGSALVDMYCNRGLLVDGHNVFNKLQVRNLVTWNVLIGGYAKLGHTEDALNCLIKMKKEGLSPCVTTFVWLLKACGSIGSFCKHQELHAEIAEKGLEGDLLVGNVLVDLYMKCGLIAESQHTFHRLSIHDVISWSSLISGLSDGGNYEEALDSLEKMQRQGIPPNPVIYVCSLKACANVGATIKGQELHATALKQGLENESLVGNILVDMYANGGCLREAHYVFEVLSTRDIVAWNALIAGYAQIGESEKVVITFDKMLEEGATPDHVTFLSILHACSHAGVVDRGAQCFEAVVHDYGLLPTLKQYTCMVDVLSRAGFLEKAVALIDKIPFQPDMAVWLIVLGACRKWAEVRIGESAFQQAVQLGEGDCTAFVCMSNIYRDAAMQKEAKIVEALRFNRKAWKHPHYSWSKYFSEFVEVVDYAGHLH